MTTQSHQQMIVPDKMPTVKQCREICDRADAWLRARGIGMSLREYIKRDADAKREGRKA